MPQFTLWKNGAEEGPFTSQQLRHMWQAGTIHGGTLYWSESRNTWASCSELAPFLEKDDTVSDKSRVSYVILSLLLGCLGIHNFYARRYAQGYMQLMAATLLFFFDLAQPSIFWVFLGGGIAFWALLDAIVIRTDGNGRRFQ